LAQALQRFRPGGIHLVVKKCTCITAHTAMRCLFALLTLACCSKGAVLRLQGASSEASLQESGEWAELAQAEAEDQRFLLVQLDDTENELVKMQQFLESAGTTVMNTVKKGFLAGLQISAVPGAMKTSAPEKSAATVTVVKPIVKVAPAATNVKKELATVKPVPKVVAAAKVATKAAVHLPHMKLQGAAALAPMLAMMRSLYDDSKQRISQQNAREAKSKKWFDTKLAAHNAKIASIEGKFKNHTLSEEFRTNETRDENRYFTYWSRCRERQHRQFHTNLKIQHGMMMKAKNMINVYEKALSTKPSDQKQAQKKVRQMTGMPDIMFLQGVQKTVKSFCLDTLVEVRKERVELQQWAHEGLN